MNPLPTRQPSGGKFPWPMLIGLAVPVVIGAVMFVLLATGVLKMR